MKQIDNKVNASRVNSNNMNLKRSNEPVFWGLFSAGGMWAAIFAPAVIIIIAYIIPFGDAQTRSTILKLMASYSGKIFLFFMISLPIWCGLHRILHMLHDFSIHPRRGKFITYGAALLLTLHAAYILFFRGMNLL